MMSAVDMAWFAANPDRRYRLRRLTPGEIALWPVQPPADHMSWGIFRREPAAVEVFSQPWTDTFKLDDHDFELEALFEELSKSLAIHEGAGDMA